MEWSPSPTSCQPAPPPVLSNTTNGFTILSHSVLYARNVWSILVPPCINYSQITTTFSLSLRTNSVSLCPWQVQHHCTIPGWQQNLALFAPTRSIPTVVLCEFIAYACASDWLRGLKPLAWLSQDQAGHLFQLFHWGGKAFLLHKGTMYATSTSPTKTSSTQQRWSLTKPKPNHLISQVKSSVGFPLPVC